MPTAVAPNDFVHLHTHSEFSLLDGLARIDDLVSQASAQGFDSLALTDHGALYGAVAFYQACEARGVKPIVGVETYVARRSMADREGKADAQPYHLLLLAKDLTGYRNLCRIVTDAHLEGYYYKPRIDREYLARHAEGLIGLSACLNGEISRALEVEDWDAARHLAGEYRDIFRGDFFLELQDHGMPEQRRLNEQLLRLAPEVALRVVATNDLHYVHQSQAAAHDVLLCVGTASNLDTPGRLKFDTQESYLKSAAQMAALFAEVPEAIATTKQIAEMTDLRLTFGQLRLPDFPVPDGHTVESWLRAECERGLHERYGDVTPDLRERLDYELRVICDMGYAGYFLIVADFTRFARDQGIATTCRGSAPGSIVAYTLGITPVDPIRYELPFERFLNPERVTMPDIDVDFEDSRRDEVIAYVTRKYGTDHVAQIITFGTMLARAAIRDVGRVLGFGYGEVDRIAKIVPNQLGIRLDEALEMAPALREQYDADPQVRRLIDLARQLEGVARNASTHAAGVVISREPLPELMPLQRATNSDGLMTQYEMHGVEALGLLKFDFLGLSNLTILRAAVDLIREHRGAEIDLERIPLDDARTFELLASGETTGIFQLESPGMRRYVRELRPSSVLDLAAMVALYRPGPMDNIPTYIRRKHGLEPVTYLHPLLEPYLAKTYGIFVYQEDIMAAASALGGFTGPEADTLGFAIRKKKSALLRAQREKFVRQAAERGVSPDVIDAVFAAFQPFERYGFNKAHATCYGLIAYQTAYLKANYTVEYMTSVLNAFRDNAEKVAAAIAECRRLGIEVLPPDVHTSGLDFGVEGERIRFGLLAVKNVGQGAIESIVEARSGGGEFRSLADLCSRVDLRLANRRVLESLIKVGALAPFGHPAQLLIALDDAIASGQAEQRDRLTGQTALFDIAAEASILERPLPEATEAPLRERLRWEKELLGLYLSDHPLGEVADRIGRYVTAYSGELGEELDQQRVVVGGVVTEVRRVITKARATMGVATIEDLQGSLEVIVFPKVLEQTAATWQEDSIVLVSGRVDHKGDGVVLLAEAVWTWEDASALGEEAFSQQLARADRSGRGYRRVAPVGANGGPPRGIPGERQRPPRPPDGERRLVAVGPGHPTGAGGRSAVPIGPGRQPRDSAPVEVMRRSIPRVSPLRGSEVTGTIEYVLGTGGVVLSGGASAAALAARGVPLPSEPFAEPAEPAGLHALAPDDEEAPLPDEAARRAAAEIGAPTRPLEALPGQRLHVRFRQQGADALGAGFEALREILHAHPGETSVVLRIPAGSGEQRMELRRGVAYDAGLVADVDRRLGASVVLELQGPGTG
ncbi:MAG TPA: DNA polymerase III subunit alpha [Candidatus Limnocylindrales bacterium]|nr:DNA polymerase III subunit alpha [Candidatus Limnocylindrales bacterium]